MTLLSALESLFIVFLFACVAAAFGSRMLRWLGRPLPDGLERTLFGAGLFLVLFQILVFLLSLFGFLNAPVVIVIVVLAALAAGKEWKQVGALAQKFVERLRNAARDPLTSLMMISTVAFLAFDAVMSAAPVASSDAMMYHFAVPMLEAGKRWEPIFWLPFSFYTGQAHSLIQLGLTLHSEQLANGSIFLAGALSADEPFCARAQTCHGTLGVGCGPGVPFKSDGVLADVHVGMPGYLDCFFCDDGGACRSAWN